jgi:pyruvate dehydrogenase E2 component (dihydrolipoamide acetyltransferase)
MSEFVMPSLGADMEDGVLVEQLIAPGDVVTRGDIIAAVETQKGAIEIEVFEDGVLDKWLIPIGTTVPVGTPIAIIREKDAASKPRQPEIRKPVEVIPVAAEPDQTTIDVAEERNIPEAPRSPPMPDDVTTAIRQRVTPAARRKAAQEGINLADFESDDVISLEDLEATSEPSDHPPDSTSSMSAMRQAISAAMTRSKREIPHYYLSDTIDLSAADEFIKAHNADLPPDARLVIGALYIRALALAAHSFPEFNGFFENESFTQSTEIHVGMAINLRSGLVAPAILDADIGDLDDLMHRLLDLVTRVRQGRFRARELSDPTITLTSLGDRGVSQITGVIFPPQVAILGIGTPQLRPMIVGGKTVPRNTATITLAADHRVSDGHRGARFLRTIIDHLQKPEAL